jgi:polycystin 2
VFKYLFNLKKSWNYRDKAVLKGSTHIGLLNEYGAGGFAVDLSNTKSDYELLMDDLFKNLWIDRATRAVFYDFTVYNANINLFCQVRLVFEMPATGGVVPSYMVRPVKLLRYVSLTDYVILACEGIFLLFLVYYSVEEFLEVNLEADFIIVFVWLFIGFPVSFSHSF